jgi:hypothetical protein
MARHGCAIEASHEDGERKEKAAHESGLESREETPSKGVRNISVALQT